MTGISVIDVDSNQELVDKEISKVKIRKISGKEIVQYVSSKEPLDKAGAFGIQEKGAIFVESIDGCYYNAVGLPLFKLCQMLKKLGVFDY